MAPMKLKQTTHLTLLTLIVAISGASLAYAESATVANDIGSSRLGCEADNSCFSPYTVEINVGDTVTWTNPDSVAHTVLSGADNNDPDFGALFDSGLIYPDGEFTHQFDEAGTFPYTCRIHPYMQGIVVVTESAMTGDKMMTGGDSMMASTLPDTVTIGFLHPLTGGLSGFGEQVSEATKLAVADFNDYLQESGAGWTLEYVVEDTATMPTTALHVAETLHSKKIDLIIGPAASSTTTQVKTYADKNDMLVFSCCSTAPSLNIAGDSVYRMVADDTNQGAALGELLSSREMAAIVPIWRGDTYGDGLRDATVLNFEAAGGVTAEGIKYSPDAREFGLEVSELAEQVQEMVDEYGADKVGILLIAFGESTQIVQAASQYDILGQVVWYGSEAVPAELNLEDSIVSDFTKTTEFLATDIHLSEGELAQSLIDRLTDTLGYEPIPFTYAAYDAVQILGRAIERADSAEPAKVKAVLHSVAADYQGALANSELNENGDLTKSNYAVKVVENNAWVTKQKYLTDYNFITAATQPQGIIEIGSIYPITGQSASTGFATRDATNLGAEDFNKFLNSIGEDWQLKVLGENSDSKPDIALQRAQTLFAKNVDIIVGPRPSGEVTQVKPFADSNGMMLVSCCSTSPALNIAGDSVYRIAVDDVYQGAGVSKLFEHEGIKAVVPIWLKDAYGDGLIKIIKEQAESRGYTAAEGVGYNRDQVDFSASVAELADQVQEQVDIHGADNVAVFIVSFDEAIQIAQSASNHDILDDIWWFGSETFVHKSFNDPITDEMLKSVNFGAMITAEVSTDAHDYLTAYFLEEHGDVPTSYIYSAYDISWLIGLSMLHAGDSDADSVKSVFSDVAAKFVGANGNAILNENGDLTPREYAIWTAHTGDWVLTGDYYSPTDDAIYSNDVMMSNDQ